MFIDKIFVINLKSRKDRLRNIKKVLTKLKLDNNVEIFEAVNGKELPKEEINKLLSITSLDTLFNKSTNHKDIRTKGAIGCYLSHYKIWQKIIENNLNNVLILEDDINTIIDYEKIKQYIDAIPEDYDIAMLSWFKLWFDPLENKNKKNIINKYWYKYNSVNVYSCGSYLISKSGAEKLIKNAFPICYQVDGYINIITNIDPNFNRYISTKSIFNQINLGSDIQINCKECDITEKINTLYNKKNNIETFKVHNNNNNNFIIVIIFIIIILVIININTNKYN
jgi:GR25 family glycosyltransferase involved in LPS biosynthesis